MKKWKITVLDIKGNSPDESVALSVLAGKGWELVSVVSLPLCRRAYLKREISEEAVKQQPPSGNVEIGGVDDEIC